MKKKTYVKLVESLSIIKASLESRDTILRYILANDITPEVNALMEKTDLLIQDALNYIEKEMKDKDHLTSYLVNEILMQQDDFVDDIIVINDKEYEMNATNIYYILKNKIKKLT